MELADPALIADAEDDAEPAAECQDPDQERDRQKDALEVVLALVEILPEVFDFFALPLLDSGFARRRLHGRRRGRDQTANREDHSHQHQSFQGH
ncbi:MAG TPA: hypothetical protein VGV69_07680 [Solirubrobacterales bacterium]|nr:hypothetical protein [Solirubrobacterales bacterium]